MSRFAEMPEGELRWALADLARAHQQKGLLATWVSLPLVGPPVQGAVRPFYQKMGERQGELLGELRTWAQARGVDLTYRAGTDVDGRAMAIMEARQEKMVRGSGAGDFDRDMLMQMYHDYEWQVCVIQALLPRVREPALRSYLERSLRVHEEGSGEIVGYLRRFKWAG